MTLKENQPDYGPSEWDINFSFDLELSLLDYLFLGIYLLFFIPLQLLFAGVTFIYRKVSGWFNPPEKHQAASNQSPSPGLLSLISKLF